MILECASRAPDQCCIEGAARKAAASGSAVLGPAMVGVSTVIQNSTMSSNDTYLMGCRGPKSTVIVYHTVTKYRDIIKIIKY